MLDRYISLGLLAFSGGSLYNAVVLAGGAGGVRGAIFPLAITGTLAICSAILLIGTFRPAVQSTGDGSSGGAVSPAQRRQSLLFFGFVILYVIAIKPLGFLLSSIVIGTLVLRGAFREKWWESLLISTLLAILGWFLFKRLLMVPLPPGDWIRGVMGG